MSPNDVISQIDNVIPQITSVVTLLNSRRTGNTFHSPNSPAIPEINLSSEDKAQIFTALQQMGHPIQQIIADSKKNFNDHETNDLTQYLIDHHAISLDLITSIQQNQLHTSDYGMIIETMIGFNNAILNLRKRIVVPGSDPHEIPVEFTVKSKMKPSGIIKFELHHSKGILESNPLNYEYFEKSPFD